MSQSIVATGSNFALSGGRLGKLIVSEHQEFEVSIETTSNDVGNDSKGNPKRGSQAGKITYGDPTFVCPATAKNVEALDQWWSIMVPEGKQPGSTTDNLLFVKKSSDGKVETVQLKNAYPKKRNSSGGGSEDGKAGKITITLAVEEMVFKAV